MQWASYFHCFQGLPRHHGWRMIMSRKQQLMLARRSNVTRWYDDVKHTCPWSPPLGIGCCTMVEEEGPTSSSCRIRTTATKPLPHSEILTAIAVPYPLFPPQISAAAVALVGCEATPPVHGHGIPWLVRYISFVSSDRYQDPADHAWKWVWRRCGCWSRPVARNWRF
jgi:hypothetical protein